jgi:hypothetical protein
MMPLAPRLYSLPNYAFDNRRRNLRQPYRRWKSKTSSSESCSAGATLHTPHQRRHAVNVKVPVRLRLGRTQPHTLDLNGRDMIRVTVVRKSMPSDACHKRTENPFMS